MKISFDVLKSLVESHFATKNGEEVFVRPYQRRGTSRIPPPKNVVSPIPPAPETSPPPADPVSSEAQQEPPPPQQPEPQPAEDVSRETTPVVEPKSSGQSFEDWFKGSSVVNDKGEPLALSELNNRLTDATGNETSVSGMPMHFTDADVGEDNQKPLNFREVPASVRPAVLESLYEAGKVPPLPVQKLFMKHGNLDHLRIEDPELLSNITDTTQKNYEAGDKAYLNIQQPLDAHGFIPVQKLERMIGNDPPLVEALKQTNTSLSRVRGADLIKTASAIGRGSTIPSMLSQGGYDGIYSHEDGNQHWIPLSPEQIKPRADVG